MMNSRALAVCAASLAALGCSDSNTNDPDTTGCAVVLSPGGSNLQERIQTALIEARSGSTVCFRGGTYDLSGELSISQNNLSVRGLGSGVVLDFRNQRRRTEGDGGTAADGGSTGSGGSNSMSVTGNGFTIDNLTIKNSPGDGIRVTNAQDVTFRRLKVSWDAGSVTANGAYAIYPVGCTRVLIEDCEVRGASDAGIYVGQSSRVIVRRNKAIANVAGIEIENTTDSDVYDNEATDNTGGILVFNLPNLPVGDGRRALLRNNNVHDNNRANFAERGTTVAGVPPGTGVLVMAADQTEVRNNTIRNNNTVGVVVVDYRTANSGTIRDMAYNTLPEGTWIHDNTFTSNGTDPHGDLAGAVPARPVEDILWDGRVDPMRAGDAAARTCVTNNTGARFRNFNFEDLGSQSTDLARVNCMLTPLPTIAAFTGQ